MTTHSEEVPAPPGVLEAQEAKPAQSEPKRSDPNRGKFRLAYLVLALALSGAGIGLTFLLTEPDPPPPFVWSAWQPTASGLGELTEIADYVSRSYRMPGGDQLVGVQASPLVVAAGDTNLPVSSIAIREAALANQQPDISIFSAGGAVEYLMCGLGVRCSIANGEPSIERQRLLRRQALELSLYTFTYVPEASSVVTFLPPHPEADPETDPGLAILFRRGDLQEQLRRPLTATLKPKTKVTPGGLPAGEGARIDRLTEKRLYNFTYQQLPDGSPVLVLDTALSA
jgi:hypothetical protein